MSLFNTEVEDTKTYISLFWEVESNWIGKENKFKLKGIYDNYRAIPTELYNKLLTFKKEKEILSDLSMKFFDFDKIVEKLMKDFNNHENIETRITKLEPVKSRLIKKESGMYYAHEYDQYANSERYTIEHSNGHTEYIIICLNEKLIVLDGVWEEPDHSGTGDYFEAHTIEYERKKLWTKQ